MNLKKHSGLKKKKSIQRYFIYMKFKTATVNKTLLRNKTEKNN